MRRPRRSLDALLVIVALVLVSGVGLAAPCIRAEAAPSPAPSAAAATVRDAGRTPLRRPRRSSGRRTTWPRTAMTGDPGTAAKPWETLAHAATKLKPGDTLEVAGGTYKRQSVDWQTSGSAARPDHGPRGRGRAAGLRRRRRRPFRGHPRRRRLPRLRRPHDHRLRHRRRRDHRGDGGRPRPDLPEPADDRQRRAGPALAPDLPRLAGRARRRDPGEPARRDRGRRDPPLPRPERPARADHRQRHARQPLGRDRDLGRERRRHRPQHVHRQRRRGRDVGRHGRRGDATTWSPRTTAPGSACRPSRR